MKAYVEFACATSARKGRTMNREILQRARQELLAHAAQATAAADRLKPFIGDELSVKPSRRAEKPRRVQRAAPKPAPKAATPPAKTGRVTRDQVRALVAECKGVTTEDVANKFGLSTSAAYFHLNRLRGDGALVLGGDRKWRRAATPTTNQPAVN